MPTTLISKIDESKLQAAIQLDNLSELEVKAIKLHIESLEFQTEEITITRFATLLGCTICEAISIQFRLSEKGYLLNSFQVPYLPEPTFKLFKLMNDNEVAAIRMYWE